MTVLLFRSCFARRLPHVFIFTDSELSVCCARALGAGSRLHVSWSGVLLHCASVAVGSLDLESTISNVSSVFLIVFLCSVHFLFLDSSRINSKAIFNFHRFSEGF